MVRGALRLEQQSLRVRPQKASNLLKVHGSKAPGNKESPFGVALPAGGVGGARMLSVVTSNLAK